MIGHFSCNNKSPTVHFSCKNDFQTVNFSSSNSNMTGFLKEIQSSPVQFHKFSIFSNGENSVHSPTELLCVFLQCSYTRGQKNKKCNAFFVFFDPRVHKQCLCTYKQKNIIYATAFFYVFLPMGRKTSFMHLHFYVFLPVGMKTSFMHLYFLCFSTRGYINTVYPPAGRKTLFMHLHFLCFSTHRYINTVYAPAGRKTLLMQMYKHSFSTRGQKNTEKLGGTVQILCLLKDWY